MKPFDSHRGALRLVPLRCAEALKHWLACDKFVVCLAMVVFCPLSGVAQQAAKKSKFEVETTWPGIHFKFVKIERILDERLLVVVRIVATPQAPASGTLIGVKPPVPAGTTSEELRSGGYEARPFSLASSVMIDDLTLQRFPALPPVFPPGREYAPSEILSYLRPGHAEVLTLQFKAPPPTHRGAPGKQTVSFLLTNAKGPISGIPVPAPDAQQLSMNR
jgi:hypothetical protein